MFARPGLPSFDYVRARSAAEVVDYLLEHGEAARLLLGGTDLFPALRDDMIRPKVVVDVKHLPGMRDIRYGEDAGLVVGAAVTMNELARHPAVQTRYAVLAEAANSVASYQIRNRATLGGNLCNASPCADTSPATLVLEAELVLQGPDGERTVPAGEFFTGPGQTVLGAAEFMSAIRFPPPPVGAVGRYLKLGRCKSGDLSLVGVAVLGYRNGAVSNAGATFEARIGLGSVAPTAVRAPEAEAILATNPPGEDAFAQAAEMAMAAASPISDVRGSADYQRSMVRVLTHRGLQQVWARLSSS
jgi:carbon-monoxide dehydrogenase medium subunit